MKEFIKQLRTTRGIAQVTTRRKDTNEPCAGFERSFSIRIINIKLGSNPPSLRDILKEAEHYGVERVIELHFSK